MVFQCEWAMRQDTYRLLMCDVQAFEWLVRDVHKLRDYVENMPIRSTSATGSDDGQEEDVGDFEILKESPMIWDGKYKLEIGELIPFSHFSTC